MPPSGRQPGLRGEMINVMDHVNEVDRSFDGQLWHACAGGMVQMPELNSKIFYFPQGHAEHAATGFRDLPRIPPYILCGVSSVKFMADSDTDEVYAKIGLVPLKNHTECGDSDNDGFLGFDHHKNENQDKPASFAKTLTQSDANNGGGFSVPRYCAETIFPRLDYTAEPPVQTILAKDVHGKLWKFRHIYRGTPRRHLLTTGWSNFVNQKKLVAGDSIVFLRADNGDLCVGIRRAKRGIGFGTGTGNGWNTLIPGFGNSGKVTPESVVEAANLAASGRAFEVVYYPRASTPEFCVKASTVKASMRIQWCPGMRFKMAFETEDSSRISWFMGTISSVDVDDQIRWPNSPWRLLQVAWDEPDLLQNVKRVSPWLVESVANMPSIHLSPFSPPRKKLRIPQPSDFPMINNNHIPGSIQGARHNPQFGLGFDHYLHHHQQQQYFNKIQSFPFGSPTFINNNILSNENVSCMLTIGNKSDNPKTKSNEKVENKPTFVLFGQPIFTEQQLSESSSGDTVANQSDGSVVVQNESSSDEAEQKSEFGVQTGHCKIFMESEDVGRTLDLTGFHSYEELYRKLGDMFSIDKSVMLNSLIYRNADGVVKRTGDEPFSEFSKTAGRLTIVMDSGSDNVGV